MILYIDFTYLILIGIPFIAGIAFIHSIVRCAKRDKSVIKPAFSALSDNSKGCNFNNLSGSFKLVNELSEEELSEKMVWQQEKLS